ncbi:MAG: hypothetical protein LBM99_05035 [Bacillales bacterium]|jgi:hypothetical protein|nr:hypothetical protein [Bacillales bacterium]
MLAIPSGNIGLIIGIILLSGCLIKLIYDIFTKDLFSTRLNKYTLFADHILLKKVDLETNIFDYVVFGNKYIYVINHLKGNGRLIGNEKDYNWILVKRKENEEIRNTFALKSEEYKKIITLADSDSSFFYNVIVLGNGIKYDNDIYLANPNYKIVDERSFFKLIMSLERNQELPDVLVEEIEKAATNIYKESYRNKLKRKKK